MFHSLVYILIVSNTISYYSEMCIPFKNGFRNQYRKIVDSGTLVIVYAFLDHGRIQDLAMSDLGLRIDAFCG